MIKSLHRRIPGSALVLMLLAGGAAELDAQLTNASAAALGLGENHTAGARGFSAIAWNPAGLAMPDTPGGSFALLPVQLVGGLGPIGLADFKDFEGTIVPEQTKSQWYERIAAAGGEQGVAGGDVTYLALQWGRVGVQASSTARVAGVLGPGAAELLLFGNAGRTGQAGDFVLAGSSFDVAAVSTGAISYGHPVIRDAERALSLGVTLKRSVGHVLVSGRDAGSEFGSDPLAVSLDFPIIHSDTTQDASALDSGGGISLDVGAAWESGSLTAGVAVRNLVDTFAWDEDDLFFRPGVAEADDDDVTTDVDARPFSSAPQEVRDRLDDLGFSPVVAVGLGYRVSPRLLVTGDVRRNLRESVLAGPQSHVGLGAELAPLDWLPLRAGAALVTGGHLLSAGVGLRLGPVRLAASAARTDGEFGAGSVMMFTLSGGGF
ncbi:MAG: hypothetical protein WD737_02980 [Gemmatimonadota bacterium]